MKNLKNRISLLYCCLDNVLHLRLFNIEVTLAVIPYSCFAHLAALQ